MLLFWLPVVLLGAYLYSELLERFSELTPALAEASRDILTYQKAGEAILAGGLPYRDFFIEYPPGSLPFFVPPALLTTSPEAYATYFASEMALVLVATLVLTVHAALAMGRLWPLSAAVFVVATLLLHPIAVTRYDAVVALTLAAAVALAASASSPRRARAWALTAAWVSLGLGAAAKLVPVLATPPLALLEARHGGSRGVAWGLAIFFGVVALFFLPALFLGREGFTRSFAYHADRGLQIESLAASVLMKLDYIQDAFFEAGPRPCAQSSVLIAHE